MSDLTTPIALAATALAIAACGARSTLQADLGGRGGAGSTATGTGGAADDAGTDAEAGPPCTTWTVALPEPIAITDTATYASLGGVAVDGERVFIGSLDDDPPSFDPALHVRVVSADLTSLGPSHLVEQPSGGTTFADDLASGFGHRGVIAWDNIDRCRFVPLADDGSATAPPVQITTSPCFWLYAVPDGFRVFLAAPNWAFKPLTLLSVDPKGKVVGSKVDVIPGLPGSAAQYTHTRLGDGSLVLAWEEGPLLAPLGRLEHVSAEGDLLGPPKDVMPVGNGAHFTMGSLGASMLLVWTTGAGGDVHIQPVDPDGSALAPETLLAPMDGSHVGPIAVAQVDGGALVAWEKGPMQSVYDTLTVQMVTPAGTPMGAPLPVPTPPHLGGLWLEPTPSGVVAAFAAQKAMLPMQVFATRLVCSG